MSGSSKPHAEADQLGRTKPKDYTIRFVFGGFVTVIAGLIATQWGPVVGGLFLAFPAILPASLTLIVQHDGKRKAGDDATGAAVGALGLAAFAIVVWQTARTQPAWLVLAAATAAWLVVSVGAWAGLHAAGLLPDDEEPEGTGNTVTGHERRSRDDRPAAIRP